jgi:hypothetical protein
LPPPRSPPGALASRSTVAFVERPAAFNQLDERCVLKELAQEGEGPPQLAIADQLANHVHNPLARGLDPFLEAAALRGERELDATPILISGPPLDEARRDESVHQAAGMPALSDEKIAKFAKRYRLGLGDDGEGVGLRGRYPEWFQGLVRPPVELTLKGFNRKGELEEGIHGSESVAGGSRPASRR